MGPDTFRATYLSPDIACLVASFQDGDYLDVHAMQSLVIPPHLARNTFPHDDYAALAATLDPWLSEHSLGRLPRLFDCLDDMHIIMPLHAAYSGRVDVVQRSLALRDATPAMMLLMVDVAAWNNQRPVLDYLVNLPHEDDWTCSSFALIAASKGGHVDIVRFLHERFPLVPTTEDAMDMAAAEGHLDVVQYLHAHRPEGCTTRAMDGAAKNGHLDVLRFLHANRSEGCTELAMDWACEHGHLEVAQWLYEHRRWEGLTESAFNGAAGNNHLSVVEFLHHVVRAPSTIKASERAAEAGHWMMVQWIHDHRPVQGWTDRALKNVADGRTKDLHPTEGSVAPCTGFMDAVESGDVAALERFVSQCPDDCCFDNAMSAATKGSHVEVVRWLLQRGARPPGVGELVKAACRTGYLDVVEVLYQHDPLSFSVEPAIPAESNGAEWDLFKPSSESPLRGALDQAASFGHLHVVQWLHARGFPATEKAMNGAARQGYLQVVRWLHKHREEGCTEAAMYSATSKGHLTIVRWLIRHRRFRATSFLMRYSAQKGDLVMLEFLYDNRSEPVEADVMDIAANGGHLGILLFLHTRQAERCTPNAFFDAVTNGHVHVAKWLHATYGFEVTRRVLVGAIRNGDLVCLRWLLTHWQGGNVDVDVEEMYPPLTMLQFLLERGSVCSEDTMDFAAAWGQLALLIKMHEFGTTCSSTALARAASHGCVDAARWLFANRTEGCDQRAIIWRQSCWSSVTTFMVNEVIPVTPVALMEAAERDDLAVVAWLHERGKLDMTSVVAWATIHPDLDTAQWILNNFTSK